MPLVFVSHAASDAEIAKEFQENIKSDFLGMCDVFVSSNLESLNAGFEWNSVIKKNLSECAILIGLLSPIALSRGWVYAEFGAGWIRDIPTIPVCHSGLDRGQLPAPISNFQALNLGDSEHLDHLYRIISSAVGCRKPAVDFGGRVSVYLRITEGLRLERLVLAWMKQLSQWNPLLHQRLQSQGFDEDVLIPANLDEVFQGFIEEVSVREYLAVQRRGMGMGTRVGPQASVFRLSKGRKFEELLSYLESQN